MYLPGAIFLTLAIVWAPVGLTWLREKGRLPLPGLIAAIAALVGKREVEEGTPLKPEQATHEVAVDTETVKQAARRGFDRQEARNG